MNENLAVAFNDIDFCLKIREKNKLIVYNPYIEFYHYESKTRGYEDSPEKIKRFRGEMEEFQKRWGEILSNGDPYYNKNLSYDTEQYNLNVSEKHF